MINIRDKGVEIWENSGKTTRIAIATLSIALVASLPFMGGTILILL